MHSGRSWLPRDPTRKCLVSETKIVIGYETHIDGQEDPVVKQPAIDHLTARPQHRQDKEPQCRGGDFLIPRVPLLVGLQTKRGQRDCRAAPPDKLRHLTPSLTSEFPWPHATLAGGCKAHA